jgi:hypothetical protein
VTAIPPRADLRTLAAEAIRHGDHALADAGECGRREDQLAVVDAVLAAVLPEHRRMVLGEAEAAIEDARSGWPDGHTVTIGYDETIEVLHRLAAAAPPDGLSAPVPAEDAPAVPGEAWDSIRAFAESVRRGSWSERQAAEFVIAVEALAVSGGAT